MTNSCLRNTLTTRKQTSYYPYINVLHNHVYEMFKRTHVVSWLSNIRPPSTDSLIISEFKHLPLKF